jgi:hypothetical protein
MECPPRQTNLAPNLLVERSSPMVKKIDIPIRLQKEKVISKKMKTNNFSTGYLFIVSQTYDTTYKYDTKPAINLALLPVHSKM